MAWKRRFSVIPTTATKSLVDGNGTDLLARFRELLFRLLVAYGSAS